MPATAIVALSASVGGPFGGPPPQSAAVLQLPLPPIKPFEPQAIQEAPRFVHVSSYYLPVKPHRSLMSREEVRPYDDLKEREREINSSSKNAALG